MGACATKPKVVTGDSDPAPDPAPETPIKGNVGVVSEAKEVVVADGEQGGKQQSLNQFFKEKDSTESDKRPSEPVEQEPLKTSEPSEEKTTTKLPEVEESATPFPEAKQESTETFKPSEEIKTKFPEPEESSPPVQEVKQELTETVKPSEEPQIKLPEPEESAAPDQHISADDIVQSFEKIIEGIQTTNSETQETPEEKKTETVAVTPEIPIQEPVPTTTQETAPPTTVQETALPTTIKETSPTKIEETLPPSTDAATHETSSDKKIEAIENAKV